VPAAIGTPVVVGSIGSASTPTSLAFTSTGAITAHDVVVAWHYANATNGPASTFQDSAGNVYSKLFGLAVSAPLFEVYVCYDALPMSIGGTVTIPSLPNSVLRHGMYVVSCSGLRNIPGGFDGHTGQAEKSTNTGPNSTPVLNTNSANMLLLGMTMAGASLGTFTPGAGWTALTALTSNAFMYPEYKIVSSKTPINLAPSWVNSTLHGSQSLGFIGLAANGGGLSLMGVGS
jgi:hypothetical protein